MRLRYVGALPRISSRGISFDQTQPDKYTYLHAIIELMDALDFGPTPTTRHHHEATGKEYSGPELVDHLRHHCKDIERITDAREKKARAMLDELHERVHDNQIIDDAEREVWIKNIDMMQEYYLQYVTNESAYLCALETLAHEIHDAQIKEVSFPMHRDYGMVLHDLIPVLGSRRPPIDAELHIDKGTQDLSVRLAIYHR